MTISNRPVTIRAKTAPKAEGAVTVLPAARKPAEAAEFGRAWYHDAAIAAADRGAPGSH